MAGVCLHVTRVLNMADPCFSLTLLLLLLLRVFVFNQQVSACKDLQ